MDKKMTVEQFMERYEDTISAVAALDMSNLSANDRAVLERMHEEQQFLEMVGKDMTAFIACNISAQYPNGKDNWETIYSQQEALKALNLCTGGGNVAFLEAAADTVPNEDTRDIIKRTVQGLAEFKQVRNYLATENAKHTPTVGDVYKGHELTKAILDSYKIPENADHTEIYTELRGVFASAHLSGTTRTMLPRDVVRERTPEQLQELSIKLHLGGWKHDNERLQSSYHLSNEDTKTLRGYLKDIEEKEAQQNTAQSKYIIPEELRAAPTEPIISNDGYVEHTGPDTPENNRYQQSFEDPHASDHSAKETTVKETTNDSSQAGGNVKYVGNSEGTKEEKEETKKTIEYGD